MSVPEIEGTYVEECFVEPFLPESDTTCTTCFAEFLDAEDLSIHVAQVHSRSRSKDCQLCPEKYSDLFKYATHVQESHLDKLFSCMYCCKVFVSKTKLISHKKKHTCNSNIYLSCSQCTASFFTQKHVEIHEKVYHDNDLDGIYLKCTKILSLQLNMRIESLLQTLEEKVYTCRYCRLSSNDLPTYLHHIEEKKCRTYACNDCSSVFRSKDHLQRHFQRKNKCYEPTEHVTCKFCKKTVNVRSILEHNKNCQFICHVCDLTFLTVEELSLHQSQNHPRSINNITRCKFCFREYVGQDSLKKHVVRVHKPNFKTYKYKCMTCNYIFQHPQKLFAHYLIHHKDLEPYTCRICDKTFRVRKRLTIHIKLVHNSQGYVEFDENYHVFFSDKKSDNPFVPSCVIDEASLQEYGIDTADNEIETKKLEKKNSINKSDVVEIVSSDDEPLLKVRKRLRKTKSNLKKKRQFICNICQKNCYTYQNFQNHMSLHKKREKITCVKCSESFKSKMKFDKHMEEAHSSSKLIETLHKILEKRKKVEKNVEETPKELTNAEKFMKTVKKVCVNDVYPPAKLTIAPQKGLSVQKFLENFTPDERNCKITSNVTIKEYKDPIYRAPTIKLNKFKPDNSGQPAKLKMPERFKSTEEEKVKVRINLVQSQAVFRKSSHEDTTSNYLDFGDGNIHHSQEDDQKHDIPEVAQEILLEGSEDRKVNIPSQIVIPELPEGVNSIHIATLASEAPFYKIIKIKPGSTMIEEKEPEKPRNNIIQLNDGTKLVNSNPLAHLLGDKIDTIIQPNKKKRYKPVISDIEGVLTKAILDLKKEPVKRRKRRNEESEEVFNE